MPLVSMVVPNLAYNTHVALQKLWMPTGVAGDSYSSYLDSSSTDIRTYFIHSYTWHF